MMFLGASSDPMEWLTKRCGMPELAVTGLMIGMCLFLPYFPARMLYDRMRSRKVTIYRDDLCPRCGYDLTKNESGTCPECGATCEPRAEFGVT